MFAEDLEMEEDTHGLSESENESIYTEDSFVEHDEGENGSEDGDFEPTGSTLAISASETSSSEDSECESSDNASTDCVQQQISSAEQQSVGALGLASASDGLQREEA